MNAKIQAIFNNKTLHLVVREAAITATICVVVSVVIASIKGVASLIVENAEKSVDSE